MANAALSSIDRGKSVASKLGRAALETSIDVGLERLLSKEHSNTLDVFAKTLSRFAHHYASLTQSDVDQAKARCGRARSIIDVIVQVCTFAYLDHDANVHHMPKVSAP